ncbi:MAG: ABC transporter ATP-binding protein [Phycisphaerae bacterium]|nr:ABC transporter ATP-binding protein [Phycisphaerae bacterium]
MRDFLRTIRYLRPYRKRLAISIVCVLVIAVLWGGGLGMLAPGLKVLVDPEGLHGWAWRRGAEERLDATLVQRVVPARTQVAGSNVAVVVDVIDVEDDGPGAQAGLRRGQWLVGLGDAELPQRGDDVLRQLAHTAPEAPVVLTTWDPANQELSRDVTVQTDRPGFSARMLVAIASRIDEPDSYAGRFPILLGVLAVALVLTVVRDVVRFCQDYFVQTAAWRAVMDIRCANYNVALRLPVTFYASHGTSDTMSRFLRDTGEVRRGQATLFGKTLVEPAKAVGSIAVALYLSWKLTLVVMVAGPPAYILLRKFGKAMKRAGRRALESWSDMLAVLEETLIGIRVVKAYTMEGAERKRFLRVNRRLLKEQDRISLVDAATSPSIEAVGICAAVCAVGAAGYFVLHREMDPTIFMTWMACLAAMFDPVRKLARVHNRFQQADAAARRIFELQDQPQERRVPNAPMLPPHRERVDFENVSLRYPNAASDALSDVTLDIPAGQTLAIVGPNGSGKTTLVSLLPRLLEPTGGIVRIDGQDITQVSLRSLRRQIGMVTQDAVLFHATIAENIAYGLRRASDEAVISAARQAFVDEFVRDLPDGYETIVGAHGATLSGGQKQRITIARAILRDPRILIFDEAMSQIDAESERKIHEAMEHFIRDRTTLLIAHRFATVLSADRIAVMDAGRVIDTGTHAELLDRCGVYEQLYRTQFAGG